MTTPLSPQDPLFEIVSEENVGRHRFIRVVPAAPETLAADLAPRIKAPYFDEGAARERIIRAARELELFEGEGVSDDDPRLAEATAEERDAVLPTAWRGDRPKRLDVQRSEFGEIVAAEVLSSLFGTRIPASRIAHKETPDQQTRGADVMGLERELPELVLVISEVKGSTHAASPPTVIDGMQEKLRSLMEDRRALLQELIWLRDHSDEASARDCALACVSFQLRRPVFEVVLAPILVRMSSVEGENDAGEFRSSPDDFNSPIRFISVLVNEDLFDLAAEVYRLAREAAA